MYFYCHAWTSRVPALLCEYGQPFRCQIYHTLSYFERHPETSIGPIPKVGALWKLDIFEGVDDPVSVRCLICWRQVPIVRIMLPKFSQNVSRLGIDNSNTVCVGSIVPRRKIFGKGC